ncbi:MAG: mechanosensitive ion channel family protein [Acidiferrobacter sp.]
MTEPIIKAKFYKKIMTRIMWRILAGLTLVILAGYLIDFLLRNYFPQYLSYEPFANQIIRAIIALVVGLWIASLLVAYAESRFAHTRKDLYGLTLLIRITIYIVLLAIVLSIFHVSIAGILAGSAVGGVVLGFAIHTFASNLLNGIFATSSGTLDYGDVVSVNSWIWSIATTGKIIAIKTLFSKMLTQDGSVINIPNSVLLGSSVLMEFAREGDYYVYPVDTMVNADVPMELVIAEAKKTEALRDVDVYIQSRNGFNNTLHLLLRFREVTELNALINAANTAVDAAYWRAKNGITLFGPSYIAGSEDVYNLLVAFPLDVESENIITAAQAEHLNMYLVGKNNVMNTFLVKLCPSSALEQSVSTVNVQVETIYNKLKQSAAGKTATIPEKSS